MVRPLRARKFYRFSATSSGKVFFGPSASRSLRDFFFTNQARYEKRSSTAKGLLLGPCFVAEGPAGKKHLRQTLSGAAPKLSPLKLRRYDRSQEKGVNRLKDEVS
jgi:hypothetical protein